MINSTDKVTVQFKHSALGLFAWIFCIGWCLCQSAHAKTYLSHQISETQLSIQTDNEKITLRPISDHAIEVLYDTSSGTQLPSFSLVDAKNAIKTEVVENEKQLQFVLPGLNVKIHKSPFRLSFYQQDELLIEEEIGYFKTKAIHGFRFRLQQNEKLMGGGQRVLGMDRRGHQFPLYNRAHYGYTTESSQMYYGLPAVMSNRHYALYFDNTAKGNMDIGHDEADIMQFDAVAGRAAYVVVAGKSYPQLIANLTEVTGRQPLPPRWALGNFASRFGYRTEAETRKTVEAFIENDFPLDAVVLDLYWFGPDIKGHMGNLRWDRTAFPDPQKMITDFSDKGVKTVLITEPFVLSTSSRWQDAVDKKALATTPANRPKQFEFYFGNTGLIDVFSDHGKHWFSDIYDELSQQGVAGWWGDLGEPEVHPYDLMHRYNDSLFSADELHNVYGHQWAKLVYEQQQAFAPERRPMILMRSGFMGSQRFGMIPWTGDVSRSWGGLKPQVELSLQMSIFGLAYTHSDLGGFAGGDSFDKEMYIRWMQYGVFQPVYRPHAQEDIAPEPVFHDTQTKDIVRRYIKLRYALLPYNYSLAFENSLTGMPLMRPMAFENENKPEFFDMADQYLWGHAFLIKPVTDPGAKRVNVTLPDGVWFDYWDDNRYTGNQQISVNTDIQHLPVFVRAGSFIPSVEAIQTTEQYSTQKLNVDFYFDDSIGANRYVLFDDNGEDPQSLSNNAYQQVIMQYAQSDDDSHLFTFEVIGQFKGAPEQREITLKLHNWSQSIHKLTLVNSQSSPAKSNREVNLPESAYIYDGSTRNLIINIKINDIAKLRIN